MTGRWSRGWTAAAAAVVALSTLTASATLSAAVPAPTPPDDEEPQPWAQALSQWVSVETGSGESSQALDEGTSRESPGDDSRTVLPNETPWASATIDDGHPILGPQGYVRLAPGEERALTEENGYALATAQGITPSESDPEAPAVEVDVTSRLMLVPGNRMGEYLPSRVTMSPLSCFRSDPDAQAYSEPFDEPWEAPWWAVEPSPGAPVVSELQLSVDSISSSARLDEDGPELESSL
ncbi:hypothetical protein [Nesterenkonia sp. NBAIMH1]|uniref:hypothetical protein n=1 Tax=Nesterenkonia sp. NBAIMH1 TaxID=2600320 RepID=UPI0011B7150C|nr:hypothetical protein [Nesterenkonia sp. NBAIMH1]